MHTVIHTQLTHTHVRTCNLENGFINAFSPAQGNCCTTSFTLVSAQEDNVIHIVTAAPYILVGNKTKNYITIVNNQMGFCFVTSMLVCILGYELIFKTQ